MFGCACVDGVCEACLVVRVWTVAELAIGAELELEELVAELALVPDVVADVELFAFLRRGRGGGGQQRGARSDACLLGRARGKTGGKSGQAKCVVRRVCVSKGTMRAWNGVAGVSRGADIPQTSCRS